MFVFEEALVIGPYNSKEEAIRAAEEYGAMLVCGSIAPSALLPN